MKPQDILFFIMLMILLAKRSPRFFAMVGFICLVLAIPLFAGWIFFTAERLTWYAAAFFLLSILISLKSARGVE